MACALVVASGAAVPVFGRADLPPGVTPVEVRGDLDAGYAGGLPAQASFDPQGAMDNHTNVVRTGVNPDALASWPFKGRPEDIDAMERAQKARNIAMVAARTVPVSADERVPNYFMYHGVPFAMQLDLTRVAVRVSDAVAQDAAVATARQALSGAGLGAQAGYAKRQRERWVVLRLAQPAADALAVRAALDAIARDPGVAFASPVFINEEAPWGEVYPTNDLMVRVSDHLADQKLGTIAQAAGTGLRLKHGALGTLSGGAVLESTGKNGFDLMAQANRLAIDARFRLAEPNLVATARKATISPNDPRFYDAWHHRQSSGYDMDNDLTWEFYTFGASFVTSVVLDDGADLDHPDMQWQSNGRDFTNGEPGGVPGAQHDFPCDAHGTAVAGCIAESRNFVGSMGVAPLSRVQPAKVGSDDEDAPPNCDSSWSLSADAIINALAWSISVGADVTNCSFSRWPSSPGSEDQFEDGALNHGINHFASSGNDSDNGINWPSRAPFVNSVGNLTSTGARNSSSNYGDGLDFSAPGTSIFSTDRSPGGYSDGDYVWFNGTSAASPVAAGVAALIRSAWPFATRSQVYAMIRDGCQDTGAAGYDIFYGHGRVRSYAALSQNVISNDWCNSATLIIGATTYNPPVTSTIWATSRDNREPQGTCAVEGATVWYKYASTSSGYLSVNTNGSNYDTIISFFNDCGELSDSGITLNQPAGNFIRCDDDSGTGTASQVTNHYMDSGRTVLIKVSEKGIGGGAGNLDFNLTFTPAPPINDLCADATAIPVTAAGSYNPAPYSTALATRSTCDGSESCGTPGTNDHSVWYRWTVPSDGIITIDTSGSNYNTVLHLYREGSFACPTSLNGSCILGPSYITCDDDSGSGTTAKISNWTVSAGEVYKIKVSERGNTGNGGVLDFNFTFGPASAPANNSCSQATVLTNLPGTYQQTAITMLATSPTCDGLVACGSSGGDSNSVWYRVTPTQDLLMNINTMGSNYDTVLTVFRGNCPTTIFPSGTCLSPTVVACNNDISASDRDSALTGVALVANTSYLIRASDFNSTDGGGALVLNYTLSVPPPPPGCDDVDFNNDGIEQDPTDLEAFFSVYSGGPCVPVGAACGDIDFNNDGIEQDPTDLESFFSVYSGGPCL